MNVWYNTRKILKTLMPCCLCLSMQHFFAGSLAEIVRAQAHCPIILNATDFGTTGTVIDQPGYYKLCDNVQFTSGNVTAIDIRSSYVTIDMNTKAIYGAGLDSGITVTTSVHDVVIKDGIISGFDVYGIFVDSGSYKITMKNMNINNATCTSAIVLNGLSGSPVYESLIDHCKVNAITSNEPIMQCYYCNDIKINASCFNNNICGNSAPFPGIYVVYIESSDKCKFYHCTFNDNEPTSGSYFLQSVYCLTVSSFEFLDCRFNNNTSSNRLFGIYLQESKGTSIRECTFANNQSEWEYYAIYDDIGSESDKFCSCVITNNKVSADSNHVAVYGIYVFGGETATENCYIKDCLITKNTAITSGASRDATSVGIYLGSSSSYHFVGNCTIIDHRATAGAGGNAVGIGINNNSTNSVFQQCRVYGNLTYGIYNSVGAIIVGCDSAYNGTNYGGGIGFVPNSTGVTKLGDNVTNVQKFENVDISV